MSASPRTVPGALRAAAARHGERTAYVEGETSLSYTGLLERVRETAQGYVALGLQPGDRVVVWAPNSIDWAVAGLAVSYAGAVLVPVNSRYTGHEVADIVRRTHARLAVVADGFLGRTQLDDLLAVGDLDSLETVIRIAEPGPDPDSPGTSGPSEGHERAEAPRTIRVVEIEDLPGLAAEVSVEQVDARAEAVSSEDVADILFTSGTTGRPKGAMSAHRQTVGVADAWAGLGGVTADDRYLVVNPFFHSFGYKIGIVVGLLTGATLYPVATFDIEQTMRLIQDERITVLPGAPTIYQSLLTAPGRAEVDLSSLRLAVTGAAVVPVVLIERMRSELEIDQVVTAFGMTEAVVATMCRPDDSAETVATTCGRAIPGMETRISDEGELLLRGEYVMLGYLDDPAATREAIDDDGWLHTGDIGSLDDAGNLTITDRLKDMYICGGFNVYPAEVEQVLMRHPNVTDVAVIGVPDERMGEVGQAWVVPTFDSHGDGVIDTEDVLAFARERLANFKVPRSIQLTYSLPRNLGGKVLKTDLRQAREPGGSA